jgi:hypothetical protein
MRNRRLFRLGRQRQAGAGRSAASDLYDWASTQHYADFATQVEAVTGATLQDEAFFQQTVDNVQRMIIEGIRVR